MTHTCDFCDRDELKAEVVARVAECAELRATIESIKRHTFYINVETIRSERDALHLEVKRLHGIIADHSILHRAEVEALRAKMALARQHFDAGSPSTARYVIDAKLSSAGKPCQHEWLQSQYNFTCGKCGAQSTDAALEEPK